MASAPCGAFRTWASGGVLSAIASAMSFGIGSLIRAFGMVGGAGRSRTAIQRRSIRPHGFYGRIAILGKHPPNGRTLAGPPHVLRRRFRRRRVGYPADDGVVLGPEQQVIEMVDSVHELAGPPGRVAPRPRLDVHRVG